MDTYKEITLLNELIDDLESSSDTCSVGFSSSFSLLDELKTLKRILSIVRKSDIDTSQKVKPKPKKENKQEHISQKVKPKPKKEKKQEHISQRNERLVRNIFISNEKNKKSIKNIKLNFEKCKKESELMLKKIQIALTRLDDLERNVENLERNFEDINARF